MSIRKGQVIVAGAGNTRRNIGEVYYSQSSLATDNSGALPLWTGESVATAMYPSLTEWVTKHTELQCTAEEYESALTTYGECPKYVLSVDFLRLPKKQPLHRYLVEKKEATAIDPTWYNLYSDGWLEQGGRVETAHTLTTITLPKQFSSSIYSLIGEQISDGSEGDDYRGSYNFLNLQKDTFQFWGGQNEVPTISWRAEGQSDTPSIDKAEYPWVTAYTSAIEASVAQAAEFQEGLSGKADTNLDNTSPSASFKENAVSWGMPDTSTFTTVAASTDFVAPTAGYISYVANTNTDTSNLINSAAQGYISIGGKVVLNATYTHGTDGAHPDSGFYPVGKGKPVYHTMTSGTVYFYPVEGA